MNRADQTRHLKDVRLVIHMGRSLRKNGRQAEPGIHDLEFHTRARCSSRFLRSEISVAINFGVLKEHSHLTIDRLLWHSRVCLTDGHRRQVVPEFKTIDHRYFCQTNSAVSIQPARDTKNGWRVFTVLARNGTCTRNRSTTATTPGSQSVTT